MNLREELEVYFAKHNQTEILAYLKESEYSFEYMMKKGY